MVGFESEGRDAMAGDDKNDDGFDPWAELEADTTPNPEGEFDFAFEEKPDADGGRSAASGPGDEPAADEEPPVETELFVEAAGEADADLIGDESVSDWLADEGDGGAEPTALNVFSGDDEPVADLFDPEANLAGTSESGIGGDHGVIDDVAADVGVHPAGEADETSADEGFGWSESEAASAGDSAAEPAAFGVVGSEPDEQAGDGDGFAGIDVAADAGGAEDASQTADVALVSAAVEPAGASAKRRSAKKKGGLGQMVGVVLGGLLALPITFAILIWGFRKDPLQLVRHVPESMAFLFPAELVGGGRPKADGSAGGPSSLDDLPAIVADAVTVEPEPAGEAAVVEPASESASEPMAEPASETVADTVAVAAVETGAEAPMPMPREPAEEVAEPIAQADPFDPKPAVIPDDTSLAALVPAEPAVPMLDPLDAVPPIAPAEPIMPAEPSPPSAPAEPEPEPLDLAALEQAVVAAETALEAVAAAERDGAPDPIRRDRARTRLLVDWYRQLSAVAEELAALERVAADSGRPLSGPPSAVAGLQAALLADPARLADLERLSRNWMAYPGRSTSGIVMPAILGSVRQVGPYWCATVTIAEAGDRTREMAVISRSEPAAIAGDPILVTGLIVDGDTVWASDVRPARADAAVAP